MTFLCYRTDSAAKFLIFKKFKPDIFVEKRFQLLDFSGLASRERAGINKVIHKKRLTAANSPEIKDLALVLEANQERGN